MAKRDRTRKAVSGSVLKLARAITATERGELPEQEIAEFLLDGFRRAIFEKCSIEHGLGLRRQWRAQVLLAERRESLAAVIVQRPRQLEDLRGMEAARSKKVPVRAQARSLRERLIRYRARSFNLDKNRQPAARYDQTLFRLLESCDGKVPGLTLLRELLSGQPTGVFSGHDIADDDSQRLG